MGLPHIPTLHGSDLMRCFSCYNYKKFLKKIFSKKNQAAASI